jgi:PAS domain S-box-containing protein
MKGLKHRLFSKTEAAIFVVACAALLLALIISFFLAQNQLVSTARYWDFLRIERYMRLCQMALENQARAMPSEESLQRLRGIGLYPDIYPPDHKIPQPNPRFVQATESVEMWGYIQGRHGQPVAVIRLSRHDINTRHTLKTVRLYTLMGAVGGLLLIAVSAFVLRKTAMRTLGNISKEIKARLPASPQDPDQDLLEELEQNVRTLIGAQEDAAARSQRLLDGHTELACTSSKDGTLLAVNRAYSRFFGKTPEQLVGTNYLDLIPPTDRTEALASVQKLSRANPVNFSEHRVLLADGSIRWMRWRDTAAFDDGGNVTEVLSFGSDITAEKELAARIDGLRVAFDQMQSLAETGSLTWDFAADIMKWTPETRRLLGVDASAPASLECLLAVVAPDEIETVRGLFREAKERGRNFQHEFRAVLPDGSLRVLQSRAEVLADPKTKLLNHLTCTLRDITALRDAEAATKRELRFREAIETSLAAGVIVSDEKGRKMFVNPAFCEMTGWSKDELVGVFTPYPYWPEEEMPKIVSTFEGALRGEAPREGYKLRFRRKDGTRFDALVKVAPLLDNNDHRLGWLAAVTDISSIQQTQRELQATNERLRIAQDVAEFGIWDWDPVNDTLHWDRQSFAIFGYPDAADPKEVWGKVHSEEEQERLTHELKRLIANGGASGQDRLRVQWPDGSIHDISSTYVILRDEAGRSTRVLGINRDVTSAIEEERELRNAQERLAAALEGGQFGTFEHIIGLGDVNWSPANYEINGIDPAVTDPAELFEAWKRVTGEFFPQLMARLSALPVDENHLSYEFIVRPEGQEPRRVRTSVFIERNKHGHPTRLVGITRRLD